MSFSSASALEAVEVAWVARSSGPAPSAQQVTLSTSSGCGSTGATTTCTWPWPTEMTYASGASSWLLNGTYRISPCSSSSGDSCTASSAYSPADVGVAAPPAPPRLVHASVSGGNVTISWEPSADPEPDLVGYQLRRDGAAVYTCALPAAGPTPLSACPSPLSHTDHPGAGSWSYSVIALRFGASGSLFSVVASPPVATSASVPAWVPARSPAGPARVSIDLPPVPVVGPVPTLPQASAGSPELPAGSASSPSAPAGPVDEHLPYGSGSAAGDAAAVSGPAEPGPHGRNLDSWAALAVAALALALAAHAWYLREELRIFATRKGLSAPAHRVKRRQHAQIG